jgi:superfamily I DNA/RNA helicase
MNVSQLIGEIISQIHYEDFLKTQFSTDEYESKKENLSELKNVASEYD